LVTNCEKASTSADIHFTVHNELAVEPPIDGTVLPADHPPVGSNRLVRQPVSHAHRTGSRAMLDEADRSERGDPAHRELTEAQPPARSGDREV